VNRDPSPVGAEKNTCATDAGTQPPLRGRCSHEFGEDFHQGTEFIRGLKHLLRDTRLLPKNLPIAIARCGGTTWHRLGSHEPTCHAWEWHSRTF
jgi:hypothetical protein